MEPVLGGHVRLYSTDEKTLTDNRNISFHRKECPKMTENVRLNKTPLSTKQVQALPHLAIGKTLAHTATAINVSEKTLYRWLREPDFKATYLQLRDLEAEIATAELRGLTLKAATVLSKAMDNPDPNISLRAAQTAVKTGVKADEAAEAPSASRVSWPGTSMRTQTIAPPPTWSATSFTRRLGPSKPLPGRARDPERAGAPTPARTSAPAGLPAPRRCRCRHASPP